MEVIQSGKANNHVSNNIFVKFGLGLLLVQALINQIPKMKGGQIK